MARFRLADAGGHKLAGSAIDRNGPLTFRLDGIEISGFAGDTVLSAVMAAGFAGFGEHLGATLQLGPEAPFFVSGVSEDSGPRTAIHAARYPVTNGMELSALVPLKPPRRRGWRLRSRPEPLISLEQPVAAPEPDRGGVRFAASARTETVDLIVVGGGIAGLSAAREAGRRGLRVSLLERDGVPGGIGDYFGRAEGEPAPADVVAELMAEISGLDNVRLRTLAEVTSAGDGAAIALVTESAEYGAVTATQLSVRAPLMVLATGSREKLPLFAGNRAVGVLPSLAAWRLAERYGVFGGETAQFAVSTSQAYRLALSLSDAGIDVTRILDARANPASRFIAFAKAYGMRLALGTRVTAVDRENELEGDLSIRTLTVVADGQTSTGAGSADALVIAAGLQPELTLWLQAGGSVRWDRTRQILLPDTPMKGVEVAGAAAGYTTLEACLASGENAVRILCGEKRVGIEEHRIEEAFESPDGDWPISVPAPRDGLAGYYDSSQSLLTIPLEPEPVGIVGRLFGGGHSADEDEMTALGIVDAAAKTAAGEYGGETVAAAAVERIVESRTLRHEAMGYPVKPVPPVELAPDAPGWVLPDYLCGRFGDRAGLYLLEPDDGRTVEPGRLIFATSDLARPEDAIAVALGASGESPQLAVVLGAASGIAEGQSVSIADLGARATGRLTRRLRDL